MAKTETEGRGEGGPGQMSMCGHIDAALPTRPSRERPAKGVGAVWFAPGRLLKMHYKAARSLALDVAL